MNRRPNIVLILADQMRPDAIGASTPNLMRLFDNGSRFTNAYCASPLCQPARVSIVTGLYPSQTGVCGNMNDPVADALRDDTFMRRLQSAGYYTAMIGKHHYLDRFGLGMDLTEDDEEVRRYGFDYVWQVGNGARKPGDKHHMECRYTRYLREHGMLDRYREAIATGGEFPLDEKFYDDAYIGRMGREFVEQYCEERPLYLNLSFIGPHPRYWHPGKQTHDPADMPPPIDAPDAPDIRKTRANYMDKCSLIDKYIGQLVETIEKRGMRENTLFVFTSDHGDCMGDFRHVGKRFYYEQSAGVPLVLSGPGIRRFANGVYGRVSKRLVSHVDLYPTILEMAGVDLGPDRRRDGRSILAMLREERGVMRDRIVSELGTSVMIRTGNWKLVFDPEQGGAQFLFNLANDPREERNLAGVPGYERTTADLIERILAHRIRLTQFTQDKEEQRMQRVRC